MVPTNQLAPRPWCAQIIVALRATARLEDASYNVLLANERCSRAGARPDGTPYT